MKMLHHRLPTYLIEYQQEIIQVSMQISYRKQKDGVLLLDLLGGFLIYFLTEEKKRKKWNYKTGISLNMFSPMFSLVVRFVLGSASFKVQAEAACKIWQLNTLKVYDCLA